jgi:hypothetical protein
MAAILMRVTGNPKPAYISTSYIERQNLSMRMQMRRFTKLMNDLVRNQLTWKLRLRYTSPTIISAEYTKRRAQHRQWRQDYRKVSGALKVF